MHPSTAHPVPPGGDRKTVVIVDHDWQHAKGLAAGLNGAGFLAFQFSSAEELLNQLPGPTRIASPPVARQAGASPSPRVTIQLRIQRRDTAGKMAGSSRSSTTSVSVSALRLSLHTRPNLSVTPRCVVAEVRLPGIDGFELRRQFTARSGTTPFVYYTDHPPTRMVVQAMKQGAADFLERPCQLDELLSAVHSVTAGFSHPDSVALQQFASRVPCLSPRERNVFLLIGRGLHYKQIAAELRVSPNTVRVQRTNIMEKLHVPSSADLQRLATLFVAHTPEALALASP